MLAKHAKFALRSSIFTELFTSYFVQIKRGYLAIDEVLSTIFAGCRVAMASSHLFMTFMISFLFVCFSPPRTSQCAPPWPPRTAPRTYQVELEMCISKMCFFFNFSNFLPGGVSSLIGQLTRKGDSLSILASQVLEMFVRRLVLRVNHPDTASVHQLGC